MNELNPATFDLDRIQGVKTKTRIIEFIGPPGIGKTTLHNALCRQWTSKCNWVFPEYLFSGWSSRTSFKFWANYHLRKFLSKPVKSVPVEYGLKYIENNRPLAEFLWNHISGKAAYDAHEIGKRFRSAYFLFNNFSKYQAIWDAQYNKPCLIDEGLLEKSFLILEDEQAIVDLIEEYLPLIPLPHAVVYLNTPDTGAIVDRLMHRPKVIASHMGKNRAQLEKDIERWQFYFNIIINQLKELNIPVYFIDGLKPVDEKIALVNKLFASNNLL